MASNEAPFIARGDGMIIPNGVVNFQGSAGLMIHYGTTAERISTGIRNGVIRYNTELNALEVYENGLWGSILSKTVPVDMDDGDITGTINKMHIAKNFTADRTFTLPDAVSVGDEILVICDENVSVTETLTFDQESVGNTLNGSTSDFVINKPYSMIEFVAIATGSGTTEWILNSEISNIPTVVVDSDTTGILNGTVFMSTLTASRIFTLPDAEQIGDKVKLILDSSITTTNSVTVDQETVGNTANGEASIVLNDEYTIIEFVALVAGSGTTEWIYSLGGSGGLAWEVTTSGTVSCDTGVGYLIDGVNYPTSTLSLPSDPAIGETIGFSDYKAVCESASLTISRNGKLIEGSATDIVLNTNGSAVILTYTGTTKGWKVIYGFGYKDNITVKGLYEHKNTIEADYEITTGNNAMAAGPITIETGVIITIPAGSVFTIV